MPTALMRDDAVAIDLPRVFTLAQVAEQFQLRENWLRNFVRDNGIPVLRSLSNRLIRFDIVALNALKEAPRTPCHSRLSVAKTSPLPSRSVGTTGFPDGTKQFIRKAPQSKEIRLAREEAAALEANLLRTAWHGNDVARAPLPTPSKVTSPAASGPMATEID